jgi:hypothetical protein
MIEVRLKTDKDKYSSNKAIKYVIQLGELKSYLTEKALIELKTKLNTFAIPVVSKQSELLKAFEVGDKVEIWGNTFAKILRVKLTGYVCEDLTGFTFLVDNKDVKERSL